VSIPYRLRYAYAMVLVPSRTVAAVAAGHEPADASAVVLTDEIRERLADVARRVVAPQIEAALKPIRDELIAAAVGSLDAEALRVIVSAMARNVIREAEVTEAIGHASYRARLYAVALSHQGFITTDMADLVGVPPVELRKIAARGGLTNVARGLYRVDGIDAGDGAPYAEAVFRVGEDAHLHAESVLAFHHLAFVNPSRIKVATTRRVRRELPAHILLVRAAVGPDELTEYEGVPSATVERAIRDSIGSVMSDRLIEATRRAADEGLIRRRQIDPLLAEIGAA